MTHPSTLLKQLETRAKKRFGQNFLCEPIVAERIVALAATQPGESVVEIGPGLGTLTEALLAAGLSVTAIELDRDMGDFLEERLPEVHLVRADAKAVDPSALGLAGQPVIANLPYNVGTRILMHWLSASPPPRRLVVMVQREVAERLVAQPGDRKRGSLSAAIQIRGQVRMGLHVAPGSFFPAPKVHSAVVVIDPTPSTVDLDGFDVVCKAAFHSPRKTLRNSLASGLGRSVDALLAQVGVDPGKRPGTLNQDELLAITKGMAG